MTKLIDGDRLETFLREESGVDAALIQLVLDDFIYQPPQTKMKDIDVSTREVVRRRDPGTSWEAAREISSEGRQRLYEFIHRMLTTYGPLTDDELGALANQTYVKASASGLRTRRSELVHAGWVRDSGDKRPSTSGHPAILWEALPEITA